MKKTVFSRIFFINILVIIISMLALAVSGYFLISHTVYKERVDTLKDNANAISGFINSGVPSEQLENFLYGFSRSSKLNNSPERTIFRFFFCIFLLFCAAAAKVSATLSPLALQIST